MECIDTMHNSTASISERQDDRSNHYAVQNGRMLGQRKPALPLNLRQRRRR